MQAIATFSHEHEELGTISNKRLWIGRVLSGIPALFLLVDGAFKIPLPAPVLEAAQKLGYPPATMVPLGVVLLVSTVLYLVPRTALFGAILLTAYLGGAVATHVRIGDPLFSHVLFPVYLAVMLWAGLTLRNRRLAALVTRG